MKKRFIKVAYLIIFVFIVLLMVCLFIPLIHDFLFDRFSVSNYEVKEGIVSDVILKSDNESSVCENIVVDNYNIFVQCGYDYKQQFRVGDKTMYYVYGDKGYHTEAQMKSSTFVGKILDYGMIGTYILIFLLLSHNREKIFAYVDGLSGN